MVPQADNHNRAIISNKMSAFLNIDSYLPSTCKSKLNIAPRYERITGPFLGYYTVGFQLSNCSRFNFHRAHRERPHPGAKSLPACSRIAGQWQGGPAKKHPAAKFLGYRVSGRYIRYLYSQLSGVFGTWRSLALIDEPTPSHVEATVVFSR